MPLKDKYINNKNAKTVTELGFTLIKKTPYTPEIQKYGIKNNNLNDLSPENDKIHKMKTRTVENYKIQHAKIPKLKHNSNAENVDS